MPGAAELEDAWLRARLGEGTRPGNRLPHRQGRRGRRLRRADRPGRHRPRRHERDRQDHRARRGQPDSPPLSAEARQAHRYAIARLAVDFVSGPGGLASALRTGLLEHPYSTPSLPLDIGFSDSIPGHIRRAVILRDQHCAWPGGCDRPASASDVHHIRHKSDGGETSVWNCGLLLRISSRDVHPPLGLAGHPPPRRHHGSPQPRRQTGPAEPCTAAPRGLDPSGIAARCQCRLSGESPAVTLLPASRSASLRARRARCASPERALYALSGRWTMASVPSSHRHGTSRQ